MTRIILRAILADPTGIHFPGWEIDVDDDVAATLVATGSWSYVCPPEIRQTETAKPKREYRKRKQEGKC
jgi:hypothetical protein